MSLSQHEAPKANGSVVAKPSKDESYHGVPILDIHVGDPIPSPRAPRRYAVRTTPDLARYFLTFNHERNRKQKPVLIRKYAADMTAGLWRFTPESLVFSVTGVLQNGQNRLVAVTESGQATWFMVDFGWPDEIITAIDRGAVRGNQDAFTISGAPSATTLAAVVNLVHKYDVVRSGDPTRGFSGMVPLSSQMALATYAEDPESWDESVRAGYRVYDALDKSLGAATWSAAHRIICRARGRGLADAFMLEIAEGSGATRTSTRALGDFYRRRPVGATKSGDVREPLENIIRGFNAWVAGKTMSFVRQPGFPLSVVR